MALIHLPPATKSALEITMGRWFYLGEKNVVHVSCPRKARKARKSSYFKYLFKNNHIFFRAWLSDLYGYWHSRCAVQSEKNKIKTIFFINNHFSCFLCLSWTILVDNNNSQHNPFNSCFWIIAKIYQQS